MPHYNQTDANRNCREFRRNANPGPGLVQGLGKLGTAQQVLWYPAHTADRHATVFHAAIGINSTLTLALHSRSGQLVDERLMMASVVARRQAAGRIGHMITTSTQGQFIANSLRVSPGLHMYASLNPERDAYKTPGLSAVITTGPTGSHRIARTEAAGLSEVLVHRLAQPQPNGRIYHSAPVAAMLRPANFEPGTGQGAHAYSAEPGRLPYAGAPYALPLGASAADTLHLYRDLLGSRRSVNIAVKELLAPGVYDLAVDNASGEPAVLSEAPLRQEA